ncbi:MAG: DNA primase [Erysipelotrichia bacterium]|nr:DNA primase [Erysipelotrichia bacterium]NCC54363.1 DNA primase [Erysipelotrichia bacterium]
MARIPQEVIENIRNHVDIVDVISHYIPLTRKGKSFKCVCPFHDDHDPSLSVSQDKQIYHCFVCGSGGNVFTFVQKYENISYVESVLKVAQMAGIKVDYDVSSLAKNKVDPHFQQLYTILQTTIDFCAYELNSIEAKEVKKYLYQRGLSDKIIEKFQLGYHPKENKLYRFLRAKKFSDQDIVACNLANISTNGLKDVFTHRIMIPIHDGNGHPVGFSARRVDENDSAKYINSAETEIYVKGNLLYNYHRAKEHARRFGKIIVVEGAMDVLAFEKADIPYAVATLGTACSKQQLKLLRYLGVKIQLCYDGDKAGLDATYKFYIAARQEGLQVEILKNQYNLDPDEIIETYGKEELVALSNRTLSWIEFLIEYLQRKYDLNNYNEKKEYAQAIAKEIAMLHDQFEKKNYYIRLLQITGFDMSIDESVAPVVKTAKQTRRPVLLKRALDGKKNAQMQILSQMILSKVASEYYRNELGFLMDENSNSLALYIVDFYRNNDVIEIADLLDFIKEDQVKALLLKIANWELATNEYCEDVLKDAISKVKECIKEEKIKMLIQKNEQLNDPIEKAKIAKEIISLKRKRGGTNEWQKK